MLVFVNYRQIFLWKTAPFPWLGGGGTGRRKFAILVDLVLLIWYSLVLFQHETQQFKQNLTTLHMDIFQ